MIMQKRIKDGCRHGTVIWADEQTRGKGRLGRRWTSNNGSLTFSIIWRFWVREFSNFTTLHRFMGGKSVTEDHLRSKSKMAK